MKLVHLTLHPVPPDFVVDTFRRWTDQPPQGMGGELQARLDQARRALAAESPAPGGPPLAPPEPGGEGPSLLEVALGTALAHYEVYWLERGPGLRRLTADGPAFASLLRHPLELLQPVFPPALRFGRGASQVWVPAEALPQLREAIRGCAGELRERLADLGATTYLPALIEATGYCLDRGYGLLELQGVADLRHQPNPSSCRAFFDRAPGHAPGSAAELPGGAVPPAEPSEELIARIEAALEQGDSGGARELLRVLRDRGEQESPDCRLLRGWSLLLEGDGWSAVELFDGLASPAVVLDPTLASRLPALLGWARLAIGDSTGSLTWLQRALAAGSCGLDDIERLALAALRSGEALPEALAAVRHGLAQLTPARFFGEAGQLDWLEDPDEVDRLPDPGRLASLLALLGRLHADLGFTLHARHELELALQLDGDLPWARHWLDELG